MPSFIMKLVDWFNTAKAFLSGKKTYVMLVVDFVDGVGVLQGWWEPSTLRHYIEGFLTSVAVTAHVTKSGVPVNG